MLLDYVTLLYVLLIGGGILLFLLIIRFLRNKVWSTSVDEEGIGYPFGILMKDEDSGAAQVFWANDSSEPAIGHVQYKDSVGQILLKEEESGTTGKCRYKKVGYVDAKGYLYRYGKKGQDSERIGYLAAPSAPNVPTLKGERTWRDFWWACRLNAYLGDPEAYVAPPVDDGKKKKEDRKEKRNKKEKEEQAAAETPLPAAEVREETEAPVDFSSERFPAGDDPHVNGPLIREIEAAIGQARVELENESAAPIEGPAPEPAEEAKPASEVAAVTVTEPALEPETKPAEDTVPETVQEEAVEEKEEEAEEYSEEENRHISEVLENHKDVINEIIGQLVLVEGGSFMMGAEVPENSNPETDGYGVSENEGPVHKVSLSDFYIGRFPVTQRQWVAIMGYNPSENQENPLYPVAPVNWDECVLFAKRLKRLTGLDISLPTEAQWEYAARGGRNDDGFIFAGSDQFSEVGCDSPYFEVGSRKPNSLGLYDMSGLVREWCMDWYEIHYTGDDLVDPKGPEAPPVPEDPRRVVRSPRGNDTVTNRKGELPNDLPFKSYGFRIVCNSDLPQVVHTSGTPVADAGHSGPASAVKGDGKPVPPVLVGQGVKTGWLSGDTLGCPLTLESRAAAFSALYPRTGDAFSEHLSQGTFSWKDTALFSSLVFSVIFLIVYFVNVGLFEYPLLGDDWKAIVIFSAFFFVVWALVRSYKIYTIEAGRSTQPFFTLFNKSLGVRHLDTIILVFSLIAIALSFFKFDKDFIPLFSALALGTFINGMIRKNRREWDVRNPLSDVVSEDDDEAYDRKTMLLNKPEGDVSVEYEWKLQSFSPDVERDCFISFWYDRELIESERLRNPFYMENPKLRNRPSVFKSYVGKMIELFRSRPELSLHLRYVNQEICRLAEKYDLSEIDRLQLVLDFVQQTVAFVKDSDSKAISKPFVYVRFPDETLFDKEGDCNCKAFLAGSMYYLMGYDVLYASSTKLGHTVIGLKLGSDFLARNGLEMDDDNTLEYNSSKYVLCETTHAGFRIGQVGENDSATKFDVIVEYVHAYEEE